MRRTYWIGTAALVAGLVTALFTASPVGAQAPARLLDETELYVRLWTSSPESGYIVRVDAIVYGVGSSQDAIRVDVRRGSTTLVSTRCAFRERDGDAGRLECETAEDHPLTATGEVTVDLVYLDDVAETSTVIRTMRLNVRGYPYWVRDDGSRHVMGTMYQLDGSDLLGSAFAYMVNPSLQQRDSDSSQRMQFFTAFSGSREGLDAVLRCRVGETRIPDLDISTREYAEITVEERLDPQSETRRVGWYRSRLEVQNLWWGTRLAFTGSGYSLDEVAFLGDHPGLWSCDVRAAGATLRTFRFEVDAAGRVAAHALEGAAGMPAMLPGLHVVDVRIPSPSPRDTAVDPAAIRAGFQFGTPWAAPAAVAEMLAALPPASGSSAPTAARGGAARGGAARSGRPR